MQWFPSNNHMVVGVVLTFFLLYIPSSSVLGINSTKKLHGTQRASSSRAPLATLFSRKPKASNIDSQNQESFFAHFLKGENLINDPNVFSCIGKWTVHVNDDRSRSLLPPDHATCFAYTKSVRLIHNTFDFTLYPFMCKYMTHSSLPNEHQAWLKSTELNLALNILTLRGKKTKALDNFMHNVERELKTGQYDTVFWFDENMNRLFLTFNVRGNYKPKAYLIMNIGQLSGAETTEVKEDFANSCVQSTVPFHENKKALCHYLVNLRSAVGKYFLSEFENRLVEEVNFLLKNANCELLSRAVAFNPANMWSVFYRVEILLLDRNRCKILHTTVSEKSQTLYQCIWEKTQEDKLGALLSLTHNHYYSLWIKPPASKPTSSGG